jgi:hypothetical protein
LIGQDITSTKIWGKEEEFYVRNKRMFWVKGKLNTGPKDSPEDSASTPHHRHKFSPKENILYVACRMAKWYIKKP